MRAKAIQYTLREIGAEAESEVSRGAPPAIVREGEEGGEGEKRRDA